MAAYGLWGMGAFDGLIFRKLVPAGSAEAYAFAIVCVAVAAGVRPMSQHVRFVPEADIRHSFDHLVGAAR
jgi:hypothetical protein